MDPSELSKPDMFSGVNGSTPLPANRINPLYICIEDDGKYSKLHSYVIGIASSTLLVFGTVGNIATFSVFKQPVYRTNTMASMFRYLSVLDLIFLWTVVSQMLVKAITGYHVYNTTSRLCLVQIYWIQVLNSLANWMLVVITIARLVHLKFPLKTQTVCSLFNYYAASIVAHVYVIIAHAGPLIAIDSRLTEKDYESGVPCVEQMVRDKVNTQAYRILYCVTNFAGPALLLMLCNGVIIIELRRLQKRRKALFGNRPTSNKGKYVADTPTGVTTTDVSQNASCNVLSRDDQEEDRVMVLSRDEGDELAVVLSRDQVDELATVLSHDQGDTAANTPFSAVQCSGTVTVGERATDAHNGKLNERVKAVQVIDLLASEDVPCVRLAANERYIVNDINCNASNRKGDNLHHGPGVGIKSTSALSVFTKVSLFSEARSHGVDMEFDGERGLGDPKKLLQFEHAEEKQDGKTLEHAQSFSVAPKPKDPRDTRTQTLTRMLIAASCLFIILNLPFWVSYMELLQGLSNNTTYGCSFREMMIDIFLLLRFSNNSINFIFYCAVGSRFRKEFYVWLRSICCC